LGYDSKVVRGKPSNTKFCMWFWLQ
jgi:hypothetical protein